MDGEDYEALRKKNIAERDAFFAEFFKDLKKETSELAALEPRTKVPDDSEEEDIGPPKKRRKLSSNQSERWRPSRVRLEFKRKYNTRNSVKRSASSSETDDVEREDGERVRRGPRLKVLFPWAIPFEREISLMRLGLYGEGEDEEDQESEREDQESERESEESDRDEEFREKRVVHRVLKSAYDPDSIPSPDEITEEQLLNIAERSSAKTYCKVSGTSCHQCRQKTLDTKTVCRSGECIGVRGQFCGPCLKGRYGEEAVVALKDANWVCPPCRGLCNCSICRTRNGQRPTGILAPVVQEEGFSSVMDYLEAGNTEES